MTQKEKELLLKDLCERLPYGVMVNAQYKDGEGWKTEDRKLKGIYADGQAYIDAVYTNIENIKPYLRPMSSMTKDDEKFEYDRILSIEHEGYLLIEEVPDIIDFYISKHLDYRGLIPMGLALEAPEDMYKIN